jgi:hypothetical protein
MEIELESEALLRDWLFALFFYDVTRPLKLPYTGPLRVQPTGALNMMLDSRLNAVQAAKVRLFIFIFQLFFSLSDIELGLSECSSESFWLAHDG